MSAVLHPLSPLERVYLGLPHLALCICCDALTVKRHPDPERSSAHLCDECRRED